jgi:threonine aldolase
MTVIDLRSDTVTLPVAEMRRVMAEAQVGDDQFGEDPSVNRLQAEVAALLGKEAALFMPSGTMANQAALRTLTRPGDDVLVPAEAHIVWHETGAGGANAGVQFTSLGSGGRITQAELEAAWKPAGHIIYPPTTLLVLENTHNRAGGVVLSVEVGAELAAEAHARGGQAYLDGARLLNASTALGVAPAALAAPFDLVSLALSKGLGAPSGSVLAGSSELIARAHRNRRMLGGAMRQVGILASAGSWALANHVERLAQDHANARLIAERLAESPAIDLDPMSVLTNIVVFRLREQRPDGSVVPDAAAYVAACRERGVLVLAFAQRTVRATTHLDASAAECAAAAEVMVEVAASA